MLPVLNELIPVSIGDAEQWVLLRGDDARRPVLLFLHGGPGAPLFPFAREIGAAGLERLYTVAYWEQRGTGRSGRGVDPATMTLRKLVADTLEVAEWLCARFGVARVTLVGHSWGTVLGVLAAAERPDLFAAYVGVGQVAHVGEGEAASYAWAVERAREAGHRRALRQLARLGPPPHSHRGMLAERRWVAHFGGAWRRPRRGDLAAQAWTILRTPEYDGATRLRMARDPFFSLRHLLPDKQAVDLFRQAPRLDVPVFFFEGRHDFTVPWPVARRYFDALDAPRGKEWVWFEDSAHLPHLEEPAAFAAAIAAVLDTTPADTSPSVQRLQ